MLKLLNPQQQQEEALRRAAFKGDVAQVELLVVQGVDMNAPDHSVGETALHLASFNGHIEVVKVLLGEKGVIDVNAQSKTGGTPLHAASYRGGLEIIKLLLGAGADPTARTRGFATGGQGLTPDEMAAQKNYPECAEVIKAAAASWKK